MKKELKKQVIFVGSSQDALRKLTEVKKPFGSALNKAQAGLIPDIAKKLKGLKNVWELKESGKEGTYRLMYTLEYKDIIFVLHAFKKKSKKGRTTPKQDMDLIKQRIKEAKQIYKQLKQE